MKKMLLILMLLASTCGCGSSDEPKPASSPPKPETKLGCNRDMVLVDARSVVAVRWFIDEPNSCFLHLLSGEQLHIAMPGPDVELELLHKVGKYAKLPVSKVEPK